MKIEKIFVCTSRRAKLYRVYGLITGDVDKNKILDLFKEDLEDKLDREKNIYNYNQNSLIQEIPYKLNRSTITKDSYLNDFNEIVQ